jgi:hypothetical protein
MDVHLSKWLLNSDFTYNFNGLFIINVDLHLHKWLLNSNFTDNFYQF